MALAGFWSYARADDESEGGRITRLAELIKSEYEMVTGEPIAVFVDREDISWGEEWRRRIDEALAGTAFFIAIITPRYFMREECRRELLTFAAHAESLGVFELLLPLLYVDVPSLEPEAADEAIALVARTQWEDWRELRFEDEASPAYRAGVNRLTQRLVEIREAVDQRFEAGPLEVRTEEARDETEEPGIVDILAEAEEAMPRWNETIEQFAKVLEDIGRAAERSTSHLETADATGKGFAGRLLAMRELARDLDGPAERVLELGTRYASDLVAVDAGILSLIRMADDGLSEEADRLAACELFESLRDLAGASRENVTALGVFVQTLEQMTGYSRDLRPPLRKIQDGLRRVLDGQAIMDEWVRRMDEVDLDCVDLIR